MIKGLALINIDKKTLGDINHYWQLAVQRSKSPLTFRSEVSLNFREILESLKNLETAYSIVFAVDRTTGKPVVILLSRDLVKKEIKPAFIVLPIRQKEKNGKNLTISAA